MIIEIGWCPFVLKGTCLKLGLGAGRTDDWVMGLLADCMRRECRERFLRHRLQRKPLVRYLGMHHGTGVTGVLWCMSGSLTRYGGENVPCIPGACATHNFTFLTRNPLRNYGTKLQVLPLRSIRFSSCVYYFTIYKRDPQFFSLLTHISIAIIKVSGVSENHDFHWRTNFQFFSGCVYF